MRYLLLVVTCTASIENRPFALSSGMLDELVHALHRASGWEDGAGARQHAEAIARLGGDAAVRALIGVLERMAAVDLS